MVGRDADLPSRDPARIDAIRLAATRSDSSRLALAVRDGLHPSSQQARSNGTAANAVEVIAGPWMDGSALPAVGGSGAMTRKPATDVQYAKRYQRLIARCRKELRIDDGDLLPIAFVDWLVGHMASLRQASRRQYRAATRAELLLLNEQGNEVARAGVEQALRRLEEAEFPARDVAALAPATSSHKLKRLTTDVLSRLQDVLAKDRSPYDKPLALYLEAGIAAGLRPGEWRNTRLVISQGRAVLVVRNAKDDDARAHGPYRRLIWEDINGPEVAAIRQWLAAFHAACNGSRLDPDYGMAYLRALSDRLARISRKRWPRRLRQPTLYSARHTFAAISKQAGLSRVALAALMGHALDSTAATHYSRPPKGSLVLPEIVLPQPDPRDLARVRLVAAERSQFLRSRERNANVPRF